jgi:hypothetical protein
LLCQEQNVDAEIPTGVSFRQSLLLLPTEFEVQVHRLGLTRAEYTASRELKRWCERNRNRVYIPEWLLEEWKIEVEAIFSGVA